MLLVFDSHPVQYKAPVYQDLARLLPGTFKVLYASDCSVRGHSDRDFGQTVAWDTPLLSGYDSVVLHNERGTPLQGFRSLAGSGLFALLRRECPSAVLISQFLYEADLIMYLSCVILGIPVWIRHETQDEAFIRPRWKTILRQLFYRVAYRGVSHAFYIGQASREHLLRHGITPARMTFSPYCTPSPRAGWTNADKQRSRDVLRTTLGIGSDETVLLFSGKLIEKKNPGLLLDALALLGTDERQKFKVIYVGSGVLDPNLRQRAALFAGRVIFTGFVNQSAMPGYYLAADILILPSHRAGETWGLVVNEALQAGCGVIVSEAVGCHREFGGWERVRVIRDNDASACAKALRELAQFPRAFDWCATEIERYSTAAAARAIAEAIGRLEPASNHTSCASS